MSVSLCQKGSYAKRVSGGPKRMAEQDQQAFEERLRKQIEAYHEAALVYTAVKLGLPDTLAGAPVTSQQLAAALGLSAPHLHRFLRGLCTLGICEEHTGGTFALTPFGQSLTSGSHLAMKVQIVVEQYWQPWANLVSTLQTGEAAFEHVFGISVFDWRRDNLEQGAMFDSYLAKETTAELSTIIEALDFSGIETVAILQAQSAGVSFDRAHAIGMSQPFLQLLGVAKRVEFVPGNLLEEIPVKADLYLLMGVLQQWDDAQARAILANCRKAMPDGSRLAIIERLLPKRACDDPAAIMLDLHMMAITGGRARSLAEFELLLSTAGLRLSKATPTSSGLSIIEVVRE